ncbi:hypothetical protein HCG49_17810 [Arenibacter sp. 6A1]|uniref:hypothetical protein n=1 Tax=Arenibacter sp. 6A1 TaxID=2720391 RepID=UPI001447784C|nr:hypothetical protein [Arenibacter sp. 6A1]NKI28410.1 hypothetical protein [Arenibacter sp. 6A1]
MKKITILATAAFLAVSYHTNAQVGIGTPEPSDATLLEVKADNKGVLIPRVKLTSTGTFTPIDGLEVESLLVYNIGQSLDLETADAVYPGFYYWQNGQWQRVINKKDLYAAIENLGDTFNKSIGQINDLINYIAPSNPNNKDDNGNPIISENHSTVVWDEPNNSFYVVAYDATTKTYGKTLIDISAMVAGSETNTFIRVQENTDAPDTYHFFSESAIKTWLSVPANAGLDPLTAMPIDEAGVVTINVVGDVVENFEHILNQKITYEGEQITIEQVIQKISSQVDGNVIYTEVGGEMVFQYYDAANNKYETISLSELVQNSESNTFIRKVDENVETNGVLATRTVYYYFSETAIKDWLNADVANTDPANMPNDALGVVAIEVADDVAANFEHILNQTITYENGQHTVEEIIQMISSEVAGNVIYTEVGGEMVFQYYNGTEYLTINLNELVQNLESNTFIRKVDAVIETDGTVTSPTVYYYFSETAIKDWLAAALTNTDPENNMPNTAPGVVAISVADDVATNFEHILKQTITYENNQLTIEEIIQMISSETDGNVIYVNDKNPNDPNAADEWVFKYYNKATDQYVTINLGDLVADFETKTKITRAAINADGETPTYIDARVEPTPTKAGQILYKYEAEEGRTDYLNITEDLLFSIENNEDVQTSITNILNGGGNVLFGDIKIGTTDYTGVLYYYDVNGDPQLIDVSKTLIQNLIDNSTQVQELKNVLGNKYVENTLIYTGDTIDGKAVAAYKTTTTIGVHTAVTGGVSLPQAPAGVVSISLYQGGNLLTKSTTDHVILGNNVAFNIGIGNHYQVLPEGVYEVIIEFTVVQ